MIVIPALLICAWFLILFLVYASLSERWHNQRMDRLTQEFDRKKEK